jgi:polysaccharide export outer membrane protein
MRPSFLRLLTAVTLIALPVLCSFTTGCASSREEPQFQEYNAGEWEAPGTPSVFDTLESAEEPPAQAQVEPEAEPPVTEPMTAPEPQAGSDLSDTLDVGDAVVIVLTGITTDQVPPHEERIKDDGTINLYLVGAVKAAGRTAGELQRVLQDEYERFFKNPVVTVNAAPRYYYVGGDVRRPGAQPYLGRTTVTKAIQAAGDFTDFGQKKNIQVIRTDGTKLTVNFKKAIREPSLDPPIYPGDKIHVPRRSF